MTTTTMTSRDIAQVTRRNRLPTTLAALVSAFVAAACGDGVTPELRRFAFVGQAPDSPLVLLFELDFFDGDADLARGGIEPFIDDQATSLGTLALLPIFIENEVAEDATSGTLDITLELSLTEESLPPSGTTFTMSVRAIDEAQRVSNEPSVDLEITYD